MTSSSDKDAATGEFKRSIGEACSSRCGWNAPADSWASDDLECGDWSALWLLFENGDPDSGIIHFVTPLRSKKDPKRRPVAALQEFVRQSHTS